MDYIVHAPGREIWLFLKAAISLKVEETTPIKFGVYTLDINPYLDEFFEPISIN